MTRRGAIDRSHAAARLLAVALLVMATLAASDLLPLAGSTTLPLTIELTEISLLDNLGRRLTGGDELSDSAEEVEVVQCPHGFLPRKVPLCLGVNIPVITSDSSEDSDGNSEDSSEDSDSSDGSAKRRRLSQQGSGQSAPAQSGPSTPAAAPPTTGGTTAAASPSTFPVCVDKERYVYHVCMGYEQYCTEYAPTCKSYDNVASSCRYFMDGPDDDEYPIGPKLGGDDDDVNGEGTEFICSSSSLKCIKEELSCDEFVQTCTRYTTADGNVDVDPPSCSSEECLQCSTECVAYESSCVLETSVCSSYTFLCQDQNLCSSWSDICQRYEEICVDTTLACDEIKYVDATCSAGFQSVCVKDTDKNKNEIKDFLPYFFNDDDK